MIKVNYDIKTTLVKGYYPDIINYASIPDPYIAITEEQHQIALGKQMCVVDGIFQEYIIPNNILLEQQKIIKINICLNYLKNTDWYIIRSLDLSNLNPIPQNILKNRADARLLQDAINNANSLIELNNLESVNTYFD
jgi:hypothetical protein